MVEGTQEPNQFDSSGPVPAGRGGERLLDLVRVIARLRAPDGCPWDRAQTHMTLRRHVLDEAYELIEAIEEGSPQELKDELGDVLLQAIFHAQIASDDGRFDIDDVAEGTVEKLVRRHPHVFGDVEAATPEQVYENWERIKQTEKGERGIDEGVPKALPALIAAQKVQRRAAGKGFDWARLSGAIEKIHEELDELEEAARAFEGADVEGPAKDALEGELGDVLFAVATFARKVGVDAESALRRATRTFVHRFRSLDERARADGVRLDELAEEELLRRFRDARPEDR